ncbi:uncharacterized protein LOC117640290 [Thrips palmi]|uniref:Uncharacterized protein LOC117640290 n=1 Tax=Thrips palmi TaxID=161013 RepID=A0A6P8ZHW2_THRPL|nr:uncharacterized protein LOC117640290 [Thrips palmi]
MGKVRKLRKKYHLACQKAAAAESNDTPVVPVVQSVPGQAELPVKLSTDSNIFAGITISFADLKQTLLPPSTQPLDVPLGTVSEPSVVGSLFKKNLKHVSKKDKIIARREALLRKIDTVRQLKLDARKAFKLSKKKEVPKPMQMATLIDALPMLPSSDKEPGSSKKGKVSQVKACLSKKKRNKQFMDGIKAFKAVLSNTHYKADPASAISNYVINTVSSNGTQKFQKKLICK